MNATFDRNQSPAIKVILWLAFLVLSLCGWWTHIGWWTILLYVGMFITITIDGKSYGLIQDKKLQLFTIGVFNVLGCALLVLNFI